MYIAPTDVNILCVPPAVVLGYVLMGVYVIHVSLVGVVKCVNTGVYVLNVSHVKEVKCVHMVSKNHAVNSVTAINTTVTNVVKTSILNQV